MPADSTASPWASAAGSGADAPDYEALYAALAATAQGRWFLEQHADRSRQAVTTQVLTAIDRLKDEVAGAQAPTEPVAERASTGPGLDRLRNGLGGVAAALAAVQAEFGKVEPQGAATERQSILAATEALQEIAWFMRERGIESWLCDRLDGLSEAIRAVCAIPDLTAQRSRALAGALAEAQTRLDAARTDLDHGADTEGLFAEPPVPAANANLPAAASAVAETLETEAPTTLGLESDAPAYVSTDEVATYEVAIDEVTTEQVGRDEVAADRIVADEAARGQVATEHPLIVEPVFPGAVETLPAEIVALLPFGSGEFIVIETAPAPAAAGDIVEPGQSPSAAAETAAAESGLQGEIASERQASRAPAAHAPLADVESAPAAETELSAAAVPEPAAGDWELPQPVVDDPEQPQPSPRLSHLLMVAELDRLLAIQTPSPAAEVPEPEPDGDEVSVDRVAAETGPAETATTEPATFDAPSLQPPPGDDTLEPTAEAPSAGPSESLPPTDVAEAGGGEAGIGAPASGAPEGGSKEPSPPPPPPPPRPVRDEAAELAKVDLAAFADVMALSDEERIALFT